MERIRRITPDLVMISEEHPVPGMGVLPISSFLILGRQPILIDMGAVATREPFLASLRSVIDPADLAWLVLTHPDADHVGALPELLAAAPKARLVANWVSTGKLSASMLPPLPRLQWVNHGESLVAGDRVLHVLRPPMYDCPSTLTVLDSRSRALFSSDAFGAFVPRSAERFDALTPEERAASLEGMSGFCRTNSPWLADVSPASYGGALKSYADLEPEWLLSSHFPPVAKDDVPSVIARAARFPEEGRVPLPGQMALDAALAAMGVAA
jgi:hypothetical protein